MNVFKVNPLVYFDSNWIENEYNLYVNEKFIECIALRKDEKLASLYLTSSPDEPITISYKKAVDILSRAVLK